MSPFALRCVSTKTKTVAACFIVASLASACDASKPDPNASAPSLSVRVVSGTSSAPLKSASPKPVEAAPVKSAQALGAGAYKDPTAGYAADLACQPQVTDDADHHVASCAHAPYRTVRWHDEPGTSALDTKKTFDGLRDAHLKELDQPKVVDEKDLQVSNHPARDVSVNLTKDGQPVYLLMRLLLVDRRVYEIWTYDDDASERQRFVSTFTLLK